MSAERQPRLYTELADWRPLFSPPSHYVEEAADLLPRILAATDPPPHSLLELGSGGGSLAFHFKSSLRLTLTDRSSQMLAVNKVVNPECEHVLGDMMSLDLGSQFDIVFVHDAIMYATTEDAVCSTLQTAYRHCRPGGATLFVPDCVRENFTPETTHDGEDGANGKALRYLEWRWDPDPTDNTYEVTFAFLLRESNGALHLDSDRHQFGLFRRSAWLEWVRAAGFSAESMPDKWGRDLFLGRRRKSSTA